MHTPESALFTDLYQLTMMQAYLEEDFLDEAVFTLFVRRLPASRNYLLACGLDGVLDYLQGLEFKPADLEYLDSIGTFSTRFLEWLAQFRFPGEVRAVREGTPVFANEPILEVVAPLPAAQLVETMVMNQIHAQTLLASKAVRIVQAAAGRGVVDFGMRRMHGTDAAVKAARAFHIAGVAATSNVLAGQHYGLPVAGTMAHSYIQAHEDEADAFEAFVRRYPDTLLLVDTYDTLAGVDKVVDLAAKLGERFRVRAVRLDSGDLAKLAEQTRKRLDAADLKDVEVFASSSLDEYAIAKLVASGAPIDGFGVGTRMGVSADAPDLDIVYKLSEYAGIGRMKLAAGKPILPGRKQIFRREAQGELLGDTIARADEQLDGRPLLEIVMEAGRRTDTSYLELNEVRRYAAREIGKLAPAIRDIAPAADAFEVTVSEALARHRDEVHRTLVRRTS